MDRQQFGAFLHSTVPLAMKIIVLLLVGVYAYIAWQRWYFDARPQQTAPRMLIGALGALVLLGYLVWRWI